jgi:hypothetical protein
MTERLIYSGKPATITVEASEQVIAACNLNTLDGEQYDHVTNAVRVVDDGTTVSITTTRSLEAWRAGEPNAGRGTWEFTHDKLASVRVNGCKVWSA